MLFPLHFLPQYLTSPLSLLQMPLLIDVINELKTPEELEISKQKYRDYAHNLVIFNVQFFHEDEAGWFKCEITWYNTTMEKLQIYYEEFYYCYSYMTVEELSCVNLILHAWKILYSLSKYVMFFQISDHKSHFTQNSS